MGIAGYNIKVGMADTMGKTRPNRDMGRDAVYNINSGLENTKRNKTKLTGRYFC